MKYEIVQPIKLIEYSEKCLAVVGETKQFKEALKEMGWRYNPALSCGPAWIFPVKKREAVQKFQAGMERLRAEAIKRKLQARQFK